MTNTSVRSRTAVVLAAGFFLLLIGGGARFAVGLTLKPIVDELGWTRSDLGLAVAVFFAVSALFTYISGRLADRMSVRLVLAGGTVFSAFGIGLMSIVTAPWQTVALYGIVFGIGTGAVSPASVGVMVTRALPGRAGLANAIAFAGTGAGQLVIIALFAALLGQIGWRAVFAWIGIAHVLVLAYLFFAVPDDRAARAAAASPATQAIGAGLRAAISTRPFWLLLIVYAACGLGDIFVATHLAAFAQDRGVPALIAGNMLAVMGLMGVIGVLICGEWADRWGPMWPTAVSFAMRVLVLILVAIDPSPVSASVLAVVFGLTFFVTGPLNVLFVRQFFGVRHLGALVGFITMVHQIFGGIGAYAGAAVFDATGTYHAAFVLAAVASALAMVLSVALDPRLTPPTGGVSAKAQTQLAA